SSEVSAAITARKVRYWNTRKKPNSGDSVCNQLARLSSIGWPLVCRVVVRRVATRQRGDDLFHLHEARTFHDHRVERGGLRQRCDQRVHRIEMTRSVAERRGGMRARGPQRPERV